MTFYLENWSTELHCGLPPLISSLGCEVLRFYGQILQQNSKYKYAVLAFDVALAILQLRKQTDLYYTALNDLGKIAHNENDYKKAIICHVEILEKYMKRGSRNEVHRPLRSLPNQDGCVPHLLSEAYFAIFFWHPKSFWCFTLSGTNLL